MKLLHDFFRWPFAGVRAVVSRPTALPRDFSVTVPEPLAGSASASPPVDTPCPRTERREPASFLRAPRHRRLAARR
ncbi:hypothetical protein [Rhodanobacter lindaniclasticus]